jgi:hypothetical protein
LLGTVKADTSCASKRDEYSESPKRPWLVSDVMLCSALEWIVLPCRVVTSLAEKAESRDMIRVLSTEAEGSWTLEEVTSA